MAPVDPPLMPAWGMEWRLPVETERVSERCTSSDDSVAPPHLRQHGDEILNGIGVAVRLVGRAAI